MDNNMVMAEAQQPPPATAAIQLTELVYLLEQATHMAKQLPITSDPSYVLQIYSSLHRSHRPLSSFLSATQTQFPIPLPLAAENSLSSATCAANEDATDRMQVGEENNADAEENPKTFVDKVEERMRRCFIKNKRAKRQLLLSTQVTL